MLIAGHDVPGIPSAIFVALENSVVCFTGSN